MRARSAVLAAGVLSSAATGWQPASTMPAISVNANGTARRRRGLRSVIVVGLIIGMCRAKSLEAHAISVDPGHHRVRREVKLVALRVDRLRHQRDIRKPRRVPMTECAAPFIRGE